MKKLITLLTLTVILLSSQSMAMKGHEDMAKDMKKESKTAMESHSGMDHGSMNSEGTFKHSTMAGDVHAEFQIMDLASMNMKDPEGKTHHVMASFKRESEMITKLVGKVKLISPSGKEQLADLKDFGSGSFAANFNIDEPGKWGVVCLFKDAKGNKTVKFWYQHMAM